MGMRAFRDGDEGSGAVMPHRHNVPATRVLRETQTSAEEILWRALRDRRLAGLKFRRQHPIGPFVADCCCPERRLVVELDGGVHATQVEADTDWEALLAAAGYRVMRVPNGAVTSDLPNELEAILAVAETQLPRQGTPPLRVGGL
jgi:very-short-patch-repair endonuclease